MRFWDLGWWSGYLPRRINPTRRARKAEGRKRFREVMAAQAQALGATRRAREAGKDTSRMTPTPAMRRRAERHQPQPQGRRNPWHGRYVPATPRPGGEVAVRAPRLTRLEAKAVWLQDQVQHGAKHHLKRHERRALRRALAKGATV